MLVTSKNVLFPTHNHLITSGTHDPSPSSGDSVKSSVPVVSRWLRYGNKTFLEVTSMVVTWSIVAFLCSAKRQQRSPEFNLKYVQGIQNGKIQTCKMFTRKIKSTFFK